jgi:hypothetical protein
MQYTVRNRRRLKHTGSSPLTVTAPDQERTGSARASVPTVEAWLAATTLERARE